MFIDLSVALNEKTPIYPGDPHTKITAAGILERDGFRDHFICMGSHVGTHMDAPSHMLAGGKNLDQFSLENFSGNGVYINVEKGFNIEEIMKIPIHRGDIVLLHTGMDGKYHEKLYFTEYPVIPEYIARYLVEKKIKIVGIDTCSPDYAPFPIHKILLSEDVLIIENLTNLGSLKDKRFGVTAFPVKLQIDAAPVRVVAEIL